MIKTYVLNTANARPMAEGIATALQPLVASGLFDSVAYGAVEYPSGVWNHGVKCKKDDTDVLRIGFYNAPQVLIVQFIMGNGTQQEVVIGNIKDVTRGNAPIEYVYTCSGGAYLSMTDASNSNTGKYAGLYITKTNNNKIGVLVAGIATAGSAASYRTSSTRVWAQDDTAETAATNVEFASPQLRNQTTMLPIPTACNGGNLSRLPDLLYTFTAQDAYTSNTATPPFNFTQDGKRYLWTGCYALRDEEGA